MKIDWLELQNFKRFDGLTIDLTSLPRVPKLVLLIGTNGSGKSSVFDAFEILNKLLRKDVDSAGKLPNPAYYIKNDTNGYEIRFTTDSGLTFFNNNFSGIGLTKFPANAFYGRTSNRQVPKLTRTSIGQSKISFTEDTDRPDTYIDRDDRFENDLEEIIKLILNDVFNGDRQTAEIRERYINPINEAFGNIFGTEENTGLNLKSINIPTDGKTAEILFKKGNSTIPYDFLSSGEKEIFNIIVNLLVRQKYFQDTVYFLDEIDLHLNTQLQKNLLKEITENWIPDNCQLWTASHSLGFIEYANEAEDATIVDFDSLDFDIPQVIYPSQKNDSDVFEIAVSKEFLSTIFEGKKLTFSENTDTSVYNNLKFKNTIFLVAKDKADVFYKAKNASYTGLIDRDFITDEERAGLLARYKNLYILNYYSIENYLYHPDNLYEYFKGGLDREEYIDAIVEEKNLEIRNISLILARARDAYPFYRENENASRLKIFRFNEKAVLEMLESPDFETFYKIFPAKDYGKRIKERQNINKAELAKTVWFKKNIEAVLTK